MNEGKGDWIHNPSKKQLALVIIVWFLGVFLSMASMTNLFQESPFKSRNSMMFVGILASTIAVTKLISRYLNRHKVKN